ncbi:arsenate reductase (glutaredoxin) [soil metagenome]
MAALFRENGIDFERVNYFNTPIAEAKLGELIKKTGMRPFDVLRRGDPAFKELGISPDTPDAEIIEAIVENPRLLQRPIVEVGDRAVMARPIEKALELIK